MRAQRRGCSLRLAGAEKQKIYAKIHQTVDEGGSYTGVEDQMDHVVDTRHSGVRWKLSFLEFRSY